MDLNWIALLVGFAGGSLMATVIGAFVTHVVFHPVISVRLDERKGSHGPVKIYYFDAQGNMTSTSQAKYFRLHVENTGLSTVRACSGYITKLTRRVGGQVTASEEEVVSLGWASYGKSDARDIPRGAFFHMDIATLHLDPVKGNTLEVQRVTTSLENFFKPKGTYTFKVLVASNNARPRWIPVEFAFDPAHDRLEFKPVNRTRYRWWGRWRWLRSRLEWGRAAPRL
ncbi:MAG: hypothetical protein QOI93_5849 [Rhodospirillaceae bacterium]|nr:hypothetical protein [Rhodospirillaceae bacterium]